ncbi:MAG: cohesin domain-containing protein [Acidobacteriota bacterium]
MRRRRGSGIRTLVAGLLALFLGAWTGVAKGPGGRMEPGGSSRALQAGSQTRPAREGGAPARPAACVDGPKGPVRVQIGVVEALTRVGQDLPLPVRVKGVCDLASFELGIQLDRHVARLVRVEQTPFLEGDPAVPLDFHGPIPGRAQIRAARPAGSGGVDGVGTLVRLILRGVAPGATTIRLVRPRLFDPDGQPIEIVAVPVRLTVMAPAGDRPHRTVRPRVLPGKPHGGV